MISPTRRAIDRRRQVERDIEAGGIASLRQQLLRPCRIIGIQTGQIFVRDVLRRKVAADGLAVTVHGALDDGVAVDRHGQGLAHAQVVQRLDTVVHGQDDLALGRTDDDVETLVLLQQGMDSGAGKSVKSCTSPACMAASAAVWIGDEPEDDGVEMDRTAPVAVKAFQGHAVAALPTDELQRPVPSGAGSQFAPHGPATPWRRHRAPGYRAGRHRHVSGAALMRSGANTSTLEMTLKASRWTLVESGAMARRRLKRTALASNGVPS